MSDILPIEADDAATVCVGSDRYSATIVARTAKTITVQQDESTAAEGSDYYGIQVWENRRNENARTQKFSLRKSGNWRLVGNPDSYGSTLLIGKRAPYRDPSF